MENTTFTESFVGFTPAILLEYYKKIAYYRPCTNNKKQNYDIVDKTETKDKRSTNRLH